MHAFDTPRTVRQDVKVYSPDRHYYAVSQVHADHTTVYRAGASKALWDIPGYSSNLYLSDDGQHLVKGYEGGNIFDGSVKGSDSFIAFYTGPKLTATVRVDQVFPSMDGLSRTTSGRAWGDFWGFEKPTEFVIRLHDGKKLAFDAQTGKQVPYRSSGR